MRLILKIILFPISLILSILKYILLFVLNVGTWILNIISGLIAIGAIASFINGETELGIIAVVLALLFSPYGLPYIASKLVIEIESLNLKVKNI